MDPFDHNPETQPDANIGLSSEPLPPPPDPYAALPPDLRVPWKGADLAVFILVYAGMTVVLGTAPFFVTALALHKSFDALKNDSVLFPAIAVISQVLISAGTIFYFWILIRVRRALSPQQPPEGFWRTIGFRPLGASGTTAGQVFLCLLAGFGLSMAVTATSLFIGKHTPTPFDEAFQTRIALISLILYGILMAPLVEEMMFRGFLYPVVARRFGIVTGVLFTGILFGLFHALQLWGAWALVVLLMGVGVALTWVRARTRSVLASFLMHVAYNSTLFVGLLIQTKGLTDLTHIR